MEELLTIQPGAWVHLTDPTDYELTLVANKMGIDKEYLYAPLDEEETARLECEDGISLIIVDIPRIVAHGSSFLYDTVPLGIILTEENIVTITLEETSIIEDFWNKRIRSLDTSKKTRMLLQFLYRNSIKFLQYLRLIDKSSEQLENILHKSMKNRELIQMLRLNKSLVYFSTSLKANEVVLEKILRSTAIKKYPEDTDLLEDVIIENKQAIEMANIYVGVLSNTMDAFSSIISNNLNIVMKFLASMTIVLAIPSIISGFWGMNFGNIPFMNTPSGFYIVLGISLALSAVVAAIFWKKKMF